MPSSSLSVSLCWTYQSAQSFRNKTFTLCFLTYLPFFQPIGWGTGGENGLVNHEYGTHISLPFIHVCSLQVVRRGLINLDLRQALSVRTMPLCYGIQLAISARCLTSHQEIPQSECCTHYATPHLPLPLPVTALRDWQCSGVVGMCLISGVSTDLSSSPCDIASLLPLLGPVKHFIFGWIQLFCVLPTESNLNWVLEVQRAMNLVWLDV